ncbi:MAG: MFS transporter [Candidatus Dormibacteria bacterium]
MSAESAQPLIEGVPTSGRGMRRVVLERAFPALHHRNYRLFFTGQLISLIGTWTQQVAQGWLVWTISHSALMLGLITGAQSFPILVFGLWGGVAADRIAKRRLLIGTQLGAMILALLLAGLTFTGVVGPAHAVSSLVIVGIIAFALGIVNAFDAPARQAFVVELVGKKHLLNAISLNSSIFNAARIVGPALAGLMIRFLGVPACFAINGLSFIPVLVGLYLIRPSRHATAVTIRGSVAGNVKESLIYVWKEPVVRDIYLSVVTVSILVFSYASMLPLFADEILHSGAGGYSLLTAGGGVGALVAALSLAVIPERRRSRGAWIVLGSLGWSLAIALFALSPLLSVSVALLGFAGFAGIAFLARANTALQTAVPDALRGRVMSIYILLLMGVAPIGAVQLGAVAHVVGAQRALAGEAVLATVILVILHSSRKAVRESA